ncbi:PREDICTED: abnormal spindle-like microcephaly-associated protein [Nanorana parkeri]|uniref:abnormal spindle-like microcephaly-associated protein n=1 Tax=Nanorana parkeri TaxID=125878 RepID=UPI000854E8E9|nr:PREDICTED: abnormal spindle-like microcephaly-associated protein [Nanorana parkeri]
MISISPPGIGTDSSSQEDIPLLSLTHFSRPPFVSFGYVQPGSSRSADLVLHNPSPDPAQVTVHKSYPFTSPFKEMSPSVIISVKFILCIVQPFESVPLTITWTPVEEGGIRELVTFVVNDLVKHQAVLLGHAELPSKKKRARWNTIKKKYTPAGAKVSGPNNKDLSSTVIKNKTFNVKHKNGQGVSGVANNPLRSCENISKPGIRDSRVKKGRRSTENKAPALQVSPLGNDLQAFIPGSLKRSKTYSILCTEYETIEEVAATSTINRDFVLEEQWTLTEHRVNKVSISPINPVHGPQHNYTCTPSLVNAFKTLSPTEFYNAELAIRHDASEKSSSFQESFHECFTKMSLKMQTPPSAVLTPQRKALSPDSFISNSYVSDEYQDAVNHTPVLSPEQFVRDNFLTPPVVEDLKSSQFRTESVNKVFSVKASANADPEISRLTYCVKKKKGRSAPLLLSGNSVANNTGKAQINSATVTKARSSDCSDNLHRPQLKSRRRLKCVELEGKEDSQGDVLQQLPVLCAPNLPSISAPDLPSISVSIPASCSGSPLTKETAVSSIASCSELPLTKDIAIPRPASCSGLPLIKDVAISRPTSCSESPLTEDLAISRPASCSELSLTKDIAISRPASCSELPLTKDIAISRPASCSESPLTKDIAISRPASCSESPLTKDTAMSRPASCSGPPLSKDFAISRPASYSGSPMTKDTSISICGHKRRSAEISVWSSGASNESLNVVQAKRSHLSKPAVSQRVKSQERQRGTRMTSSTPNLWKSHKTKPEVKGKPTLAKSRQIDKTELPQLHSAVTFKHSKRVVAVPQSKLTFMKTAKTVIPRHPMPFAAKNMFYDERWMAKQERGFTWWLNFILTPDDFAVKTDSMKVNAAALILGAESSHKVSVPKAPTKEEVSLKAYTARCRLNRLRRSACRLFTSDPVVKAIRRLEVEIEARRLLVRKDRHLWKDVGERQKILSWLLSYNPLWLRVALETTFGELISLDGNSDVTGLALFILNRLLWNPDIAAEYRHPSVPHLYRDGHEEALSKFTLKKLLLLVFFLDYAKQSRLIDHDPCLFCKDAEFKTSKDLLLAFSRDFLSGEGDLSRHLGYLGLHVSHVQTPLDEFDFAVTNLAVDLQCGVRLVRMMELLTHNWSLSKKLRVPAISRLQKMHNVEVALQVLADRGVQIKDERGHSISSKDIVDRHRERTLALLWNIVFTFQVEVVLNVDNLKEEIKFLTHRYSTQKRLAALRALSFPTVAKKRDSNPFLPENYNEPVLLLMEWVNAVCAFYNTKVENFTVSFSDGRVFCYLINHYHPSYVALDAICQRTTQTIECNENGTVGLNSSSDSDNSVDMWSGMCDEGFTTSALFKELLDNERTNFILLQTAVSNLGGIPAMIHHTDTSNTIPDEKIVITFLSFLCARLLDIRKEARAARVIQAAWRKYKVTAEEQLLQKKHKAASVIQIAVRKFLSRRWVLKMTTSAVVIQKHWRRYLAYKELLKLKLLRQKEIESSAAIVIQRIWRGFAARKYYIKLRKCVVLLQARMRTKMAVLAYKKTTYATATLQRHVRSWMLAKKDRQNFLQFKCAALTIQSAFRRWRCKKLKRETSAVLVLQKAYRKWQNYKLETKGKAATFIQSFYRMSRERRKYLSLRAAAVKIQSLVRMRQKRIHYLVQREKVIFVQTLFRANLLMCTERKSFLQMRAACVKIQSKIKGHLARKQIKLWHKAATTLQANYRMHMTRRKYLRIQRAVVIIQEHFRAYKLAAYHRERFLLMQCSAVRIQAACRGYISRKQIQIQHVAALSIQTTFRCYMVRKRYLRMRQSAMSIQRWYRGQKQLKGDVEHFWKMKRAVSTIQATYRGWLMRKQLHKWTMAAVTIQSAFRKCSAQRRFKEVKMATLIIQRNYHAVLMGRKERQKYLNICLLIRKVQATWRGKRVRQEVQRQHKMATLVQSYYRMYVCYAKYKTTKQAAILIQCHYRAYVAGKAQRMHYVKVKAAANHLQAAFRGWQIRKHLMHLHNAACTIQASYRSFRIRKEYLSLRMATILIQRQYRAVVAAKLHREQYLILRNNTIKLQSVYRGMRTRQRIVQMQRSATLLQSHYRARRESRNQKQQYLALKNAACTLQSAWRGKKAREQMRRMHAAAKVVQAWYRMVKQQQAFKNLKKATVRVQQCYRASREQKKQLLIFNNTRKAVLCIQSAFRAAKVQREFRGKRQAAVVIQKTFKSFLARRRFLALQKATVCIQRRFKSKKLGDRHRQDYLRARRAALVLQAAFRGFQDRRKLRQMHSSATVLQGAFRMHKERVAYQKLKQSAITIQQCYRAFKISAHERETFLKKKKSAVIIQSAYRGAKVRRSISQMNEAAFTIQATFRMYQCRNHYKKFLWAVCVIQQRYRANKQRDFDLLRYSFIRDSTLLIQAAYRGWHVRKELRTMTRAATVIQRQFRAYRERKQYLLLRSSALCIQRRYRATVLLHRYWDQYLSLRKAVVCVQASYRGFKVRKDLALKHAMALRIQSAFRNYRALVLYRSQQDAARKIQAWYRSTKDSRYARASFLRLRRAAVVIQAGYKGMTVRKNMKVMIRAATLIQSNYRMYIQKKYYKSLLKATQTLQQRYRAKKAREQDLCWHRAATNSAVLLQATFRGFQDRQKLRQMHFSATVIQAAFRMHKERVAYQKLKQSAITIQQCYRAFKISAHERETFLKKKKSAVIIQSAYRGAKVRRSISQMNKAAFTIQATFRMHQCRHNYKKFLWAVCVIQQRYRANKQRDFDLLRYSFIRDSTLLIQAAYRGWHVRKELRTMTGAATVIQRQFRAYRGAKVRRSISQMNKAAFTIQATFRMHQCRHHYKKFLWAVCVIQQRYRANKQRDFDLLRYSFIRKAVVCVQASYRGFKVRKDLALKHAIVFRIQSAFRNYKALVLYRSQQDAARKIQAWYRSTKDSRYARASFLRLRRAAVVIQAGYKGMTVRKNMKVMIRAATIIQSNYQMYIQKKYYKSLLKATQTLQQRYRAKKVGERDLCWYQAAKNSTVLLQAAFRGMKVRRRLQGMHHAATAIQRFLRGYLKRKVYLKLKSAALCLQRRYRASVLARSQRLNFLTCRKAVVSIQSAYRGYKVRQRLVQKYQATTEIQLMMRMYKLQTYSGQRTPTVLQKNYSLYQTYVLRERECYLRLQNVAVVLQASYRGMKSRRKTRKMHGAATVIQAYYRMHRQRKSYLDLRRATRSIQLHFRATLLRNEAVKEYNVLRKVAILIQRRFRAIKSREVKAVVVIQTTWKMYRERKAFIKAKSAAVCLQAAFRGHRARKRCKIMVESACHIQSWYRRCHQAHLQRIQYLSIRTSAIVIQSAFRGFVARQSVKKERAARVLQSYYRMAVCRKRFLQLRACVIKLQTSYRMQKAMEMYKKQKVAAVIIQQWYKSLITMKHQRAAFLKARRQIICVQAAVRRFNAKRLFKRIQHTALMRQIARRNAERRLLRFASAVHHHLCAVKIQRWFRSRLILKKAQMQIHHVIYIQRWYRSRLQRRQFVCTREKVICVQRLVRSWIHRRNKAAVTIQRCVRVFLQSKQQAKMACGIVKFQALWRGHQWRKAHDTKKLRTLRNRLRKVSEETKDEDKLCNRTLVALNYLLSYKHFSYILAALKHLEAATRLSSLCCENMAQSGAVKIIFTLIRSCNRSIPCMEVIRLSIQILLNLTKYEKTVSAVYEVEDSVEVLLDLMQIYREKPGDKVPEKGGSIFTKTCCLLAIFGLDSQRAQEIRSIPKAMDRISGIYRLISRKHKMDAARNVSKQLMNSSRVHGNTSSQSTPFHTRIVSRIKPDWVLRKDNMREIVDPLQAIQLVVSTFALPIGNHFPGTGIF